MPFTAFTYGDPTRIAPILTGVAVRAQGPTFAGGTNSLPAPVAVIIQNATLAVAYTTTITASGGAPSYTFSLLSGALPTGTTLASSGVISGTPSATGTFSFTIKATDSVGAIGTQAFQIIVGAAAAGASNYGYVG